MASAGAKSIRPKARNALLRPRLFRRLDDARRTRSAVWVSGPPGSGKTTLLTTWIGARRAKALWLRLDECDADPASLFRQLAAAAAHCARRGSVPRVPACSPGDDPAAASRYFFRALFKSLPSRAVVVLDDLDATSLSPGIVAALRCAIDEVGDGQFLVLAARAPPPAALSRSRVHGALTTIDGAELQASASEAAALSRLHGRGGGAASTEALRREIHGWMAGLTLGLAGGAHDGRRAPARRDAFDYLAGEAFEGVDPEVQQLLMEAALLDDPSAATLERSTGRANAGEVLSTLARRGLFVLMHDDGTRRFELHALFRTFLLTRGRDALPPGRADEVRRRAAAALAAEGHQGADEALSLLASAGLVPELAALLRKEAGRLHGEGRGRDLAAWLARLPPALVADDPWLTLWDATTRAPFDPQGAGERADRAFAAFEQAGDAAGAWLAWAAATESIILDWSDFSAVPRWLEAFERLHGRHPFPSEEIRVRVTLVALAAFGYHAPGHPLADSVALSARALALSTADGSLRLIAAAYFTHFANWWRGDFERSRAVVDAVAPLARAEEADPAAAILWLTMEAAFHAALGDEVSAARSADLGRARAKQTGIRVWDLVLHVQGLWAGFRADDLPSAQRHLSAMRAHSRPGNDADLAFVRVNEALLALRRGDASEALGLSEQAAACAKRASYAVPAVMALLVRVRGCSLLGDTAAAADAIQTARSVVADLRSPPFDQVLALLEADHRLRAEGVPAAAEPLARALAHGAAGLPHARYLLSRADLATLLGAAVEVDAARPTALQLAEALALPAPAGAGAEWPWEVRVRIFGPPTVERRGVELDAPPKSPRKPFELLRALVALGGRDVPEAALAEALWPDSDGDAAHHALETTLYRLRRLVGPAAVVQRGGHLTVDRSRCWVDVLELDDRLARVARAPVGRAAIEAEVAGIAALLRGPLLPRDGDAPWAVEARSRLRRLLSRAIDRLAAARAEGLEPLIDRIERVDPEAVPAALRGRSRAGVPAA